MFDYWLGIVSCMPAIEYRTTKDSNYPMENFIVSARKYRPATFDTVVGQKAITSTLKNAIKNNHLAQAFLFTGPRGVGKTTCARILAKTINCKHLTENIEPCDACEPCLSFNRSATMNIFELDAASNNSVDDIRALVEQVRIPPQSGTYKVYIIDEVHMLSTAAFNAFLKTLEEPPAYAKFILATTEKHKILPTILSRCQIYDFKRITVEDAAEHLAYVAQKEGVEAEQEALHMIALKADGAMRDALSIFDQMVSVSGHQITYRSVIDSLNILDVEYYFKLTDILLEADTTAALVLLNDVIENGFDEHSFIIGLSDHLRNLLLCTNEQTITILETSAGIKERYKQQVVKCTLPVLIKAIDLINTCDINYKTSSQKRLLVELTLLQICSITNTALQMISAAPTVKPSSPSVSPAPAAPAAKPAAPATPPAPSTTVVPPKPVTGTMSIKEQMNAARTERDKEKEILIQEKPKEAFTEEQLLSSWKTHTQTFAKEYPALFRTLTANKIELNETTIVLPIENKTQEEEIKQIKLELLEKIRTDLNNFDVQLDTKLIEVSQADRAITPQDKFNVMSEKNPDLAVLKDQLKLNIDY